MELILAYILIGIGLALMAGELFFPTGGIIFLLAVIAIAAGVVMTFYYGDPATGVATLFGVFVTVPAVCYAGATLWPRTRWGKALVQPGDDATLAVMPVNLELEALRGRFGRALSDLRPAGAVDFDGRRVDVITEGQLVPEGAWVRCIDVKTGRVLVRRVEAPNFKDLNDLGT